MTTPATKSRAHPLIELLDRAAGRLARRGLPDSERRAFAELLHAKLLSSPAVVRLAPGLKLPDLGVRDLEATLTAGVKAAAIKLPIGPGGLPHVRNGSPLGFYADVEEWRVVANPLRVDVNYGFYMDSVGPLMVTFRVTLEEPQSRDGQPIVAYEIIGLWRQ